MFTVEQIQAAHSKVKSGADFPAYIKEIKEHGVTHYDAFVNDGHVDYHGINEFTITVPAKYEKITIARELNLNEFKAQLLAHQQGKTDYLTFIKMCAETGIKGWKICLDKMTCTYLDSNNNEVLVEQIPQ